MGENEAKEGEFDKAINLPVKIEKRGKGLEKEKIKKRMRRRGKRRLHGIQKRRKNEIP